MAKIFDEAMLDAAVANPTAAKVKDVLPIQHEILLAKADDDHGYLVLYVPMDIDLAQRGKNGLLQVAQSERNPKVLTATLRPTGLDETKEQIFVTLRKSDGTTRLARLLVPNLNVNLMLV